MVITGNGMKKMELRKQLLSYSVAYPDRHDKIEDLLANVPSDTALEPIADNPFISRPYFKILHAINTLFYGFDIITKAFIDAMILLTVSHHSLRKLLVCLGAK